MKISISKDKPKIEATITLKGDAEKVNRVLALLGMIERNGNAGHSGIFGIAWDGDGSDQVQFEGLKEVRKANAEGYSKCSDYGSYVEYVGEGNTFYVLTNTRDVQSKMVWPPKE